MSGRIKKFPTPKAIYTIIDEAGMSLWCKGKCYLLDEKGRRLYPGWEPASLSDRDRIRFIALAQVQEDFLQKELADIQKAKAILLSLKPRKEVTDKKTQKPTLSWTSLSHT